MWWKTKKKKSLAATTPILCFLSFVVAAIKIPPRDTVYENDFCRINSVAWHRRRYRHRYETNFLFCFLIVLLSSASRSRATDDIMPSKTQKNRSWWRTTMPKIIVKCCAHNMGRMTRDGRQQTNVKDKTLWKLEILQWGDVVVADANNKRDRSDDTQ